MGKITALGMGSGMFIMIDLEKRKDEYDSSESEAFSERSRI
jgi:hypothetical protein